MKILIAPDSFKESLSAIEVCRAIQSGFSQIFANADYTLLPMADGGEGTSAALSYALGGEWQKVVVNDPLMRAVTARYLLLADNTAVIEVAEACGLHLLTVQDRNPMLTSSYGVGELIIDAINQGAKRIIIGLGGSATNDAGLGMLMALGMRFYDHDDALLVQGGAQLTSLSRIDETEFDKKVLDKVFEVACDVTNPLCGTQGASAIFGPQKGASAEQVQLLDEALARFALISQQNAPKDSKDIKDNSGAGAAGGLGFALMRYCQASLQSGFDTVAETLNLAQHIKDADLVITGEGKLDVQTAMGKVAGGISQLSRTNQTPVIAICGSVDQRHCNHTQAFDVVTPSIQKLESMDAILKNAYDNIETTAMNIAAAIRLGQNLKH